MKLKTIGKTGNMTLAEYSREECRSIFAESCSYVLEKKRFRGEDYCGSQCSEERSTSYEEIIPERVLVRDGHFCGVSLIVQFDRYNGGADDIMEEVQLFIDAPDVRTVRDGYDFSNDDHSRWDYTDYRLIPCPED